MVMQPEPAHAPVPVVPAPPATDEAPRGLAAGDAVVLAAIARGDQRAVAVLYDRYGGLAYALASLPAAQRQALELAYYGGCTQAQIAALTGAPLAMVTGRLRLGLRKLRDVLAAAAPPTA